VIEHGDTEYFGLAAGRARQRAAVVRPLGALPEAGRGARRARRDRGRAAIPLVDDIGDAQQRQGVLVRLPERDGFAMRGLP
jgi:hypothetical protein